MKFETINAIKVNDPATYVDKLFITFDIDWCSDEVLSYTLDLLEEHNVKATFFVTHDTPLLQRMKANPNLELGIHPNFNPLLSGGFRYGSTVAEVVSYYKKLVPDAVSVRSHCLTQGSIFDKVFKDEGLLYECNFFIPPHAGVINPYLLTSGLVKVPHVFEDDVSMVYDPSFNLNLYLNHPGIKVFDFHPIHVFLNTENMQRYENSRPVHRNHEELKKHVNTKRGSQSILLDLIG